MDAPSRTARRPALQTPIKPLRILIFHGYLLDGTGSNVYNARLASALVELGHEVHLFSQDRHPESYAFVDAAGDWDGGRLQVRPLRDGQPRCTVYRPDVGGLLPVYVHDRYEGTRARTFADCAEVEVRAYLDANVEAVREVVDLDAPHVALANHLVMGPAILARALGGKIPFAVKVHGSALEYTVKRDPERFLAPAREGIAAASGILAGSRHTAESLWRALGQEWVVEHRVVQRTGLGPPGVDVQRFRPRGPAGAAAGIARLRSLVPVPIAAQTPAPQTPAPIAALSPAAAQRGGGDAFAREAGRAAAALADLDPAAPNVAYVGKLIVSKGVDLLLAAWPFVLAETPDARLVVVGFGAFQEALEAMYEHLCEGDLEAVRAIALAGRELEGGPPGTLRHLLAFLDWLAGGTRERYLDGCARMRTSVSFTGRLDHEELVELLPACNALVVPSTFPEAFGMVAAEAAACGVLPISANHSGLAEVTTALAAAVPETVVPLMSFSVDDNAIRAIAARVNAWLRLTAPTKRQARDGMVRTVVERWSWQGVAQTVLAAARGDVRAP